jgi:hypothetical protein
MGIEKGKDIYIKGIDKLFNKIIGANFPNLGEKQ